MRIHTAVFRPWKPHYAWFGRDSGLVTEGLNSIGVESRLVILDTPGMPQDERFFPASREDFCSSDFWRGLRLDAVVLQGGEGANEPVSAAIRESGTRLLLRLDSDGVMAGCLPMDFGGGWPITRNIPPFFVLSEQPLQKFCFPENSVPVVSSADSRYQMPSWWNPRWRHPA